MYSDKMSEKVKQFYNLKVYTFCIELWNGYEDLREDFETIYILKSELQETLEKYKWKIVAFQEGLKENYFDFDYWQYIEKKA